MDSVFSWRLAIICLTGNHIRLRLQAERTQHFWPTDVDWRIAPNCFVKRVFAYVCILKLDQNGCPIEIWLGEDLPFVRVAPKMAGTRVGKLGKYRGNMTNRPPLWLSFVCNWIGATLFNDKFQSTCCFSRAPKEPAARNVAKPQRKGFRPKSLRCLSFAPCPHAHHFRI